MPRGAACWARRGGQPAAQCRACSPQHRVSWRGCVWPAGGGGGGGEWAGLAAAAGDAEGNWRWPAARQRAADCFRARRTKGSQRACPHSLAVAWPTCEEVAITERVRVNQGMRQCAFSQGAFEDSAADAAAAAPTSHRATVLGAAGARLPLWQSCIARRSSLQASREEGDSEPAVQAPAPGASHPAVQAGANTSCELEAGASPAAAAALFRLQRRPTSLPPPRSGLLTWLHSCSWHTRMPRASAQRLPAALSTSLQARLRPAARRRRVRRAPWRRWRRCALARSKRRWRM